MDLKHHKYANHYFLLKIVLNTPTTSAAIPINIKGFCDYLYLTALKTSPTAIGKMQNMLNVPVFFVRLNEAINDQADSPKINEEQTIDHKRVEIVVYDGTKGMNNAPTYKLNIPNKKFTWKVLSLILFVSTIPNAHPILLIINTRAIIVCRKGS